MKKKFRNEALNNLFRENDPPEMTEAINAIIAAKHFVKRPASSHLKMRKVNYFPTTGTITVDGEGRAKPERELEHLIPLLNKMYPRKK
ncbi:MAG: hypothetical protein EKK40_13825 [Bradyrhizobiaceae bacterium]|nr:MAG: hypothetical protein EKK40_13825 [Bradyrhizobiaceae bacterium]